MEGSLGSRIHAILRVSYVSEHPSVMCPGHTLVPGIHAFTAGDIKTWMRRSSPRMTNECYHSPLIFASRTMRAFSSSCLRIWAVNPAPQVPTG
jgi:hypothetical protein